MNVSKKKRFQQFVQNTEIKQEDDQAVRKRGLIVHLNSFCSSIHY